MNAMALVLMLVIGPEFDILPAAPKATATKARAAQPTRYTTEELIAMSRRSDRRQGSDDLVQDSGSFSSGSFSGGSGSFRGGRGRRN